MSDSLVPVVLEGSHVRLEPLALEHVDALAEVALDPALWEWTIASVTTREEMAAYVRTALEWQAEGHALPFATIEKETGRVVGTTRFGNYEPSHKRIEIGWTTVAKPWQRSSINTEAKLLMLSHGFDALGLNRIELKTDALNHQSRAAILRLGAREEGVLRQHAITSTGRVRDSIYYSILAEEWPVVRSKLRARLVVRP